MVATGSVGQTGPPTRGLAQGSEKHSDPQKALANVGFPGIFTGKHGGHFSI